MWGHCHRYLLRWIYCAFSKACPSSHIKRVSVRALQMDKLSILTRTNIIVPFSNGSMGYFLYSDDILWKIVNIEYAMLVFDWLRLFQKRINLLSHKLLFLQSIQLICNEQVRPSSLSSKRKIFEKFCLKLCIAFHSFPLHLNCVMPSIPRPFRREKWNVCLFTRYQFHSARIYENIGQSKNCSFIVPLTVLMLCLQTIWSLDFTFEPVFLPCISCIEHIY